MDDRLVRYVLWQMVKWYMHRRRHERRRLLIGASAVFGAGVVVGAGVALRRAPSP